MMKRAERLKQIAEADRLTEDEKIYVRKTAETMSVPFHATRCEDCYKDMAVVLWRMVCEAELKKDKTRKYVLRAGVDVIWKGHRINATCSDAELKQYLAGGFPRDFFLRYESNE